MNDRQFFEALRRPCPVPEGTRIRLIAMNNDPSAIEPGTEGTVTGGNGAQMYVDWDNGRTLMLLPGEDVWQVVS